MNNVPRGFSCVAHVLTSFTTFFMEPFVIPPFGYVKLTVAFTPTERAGYSDDLVIQSDDPVNRRIPVLLTGEGEPAN